MRQCLGYLSKLASTKDFRVIALVHKRELADFPDIEYIELPWAIDNWGKRLWCEYITMNNISKSIDNIDLWLSLHDTTPRVQAQRQAVYCQTSFPFFKWHIKDFQFDKKIPLFAIFTKFAYQLGIRKNRYLIVQQEWLRDGFSKMFSIPQNKFIVAPPPQNFDKPHAHFIPREELFTFFFASTPDSHKGFEILCRAAYQLEQEIGTNKFQIILTVAGNENKYAEYLFKNWGHISSIRFQGLMDKPTLYAHYQNTDCFVFPSRIETWGLPISEYLHTHNFKRPLIVADLPYAHETSQRAEKVCFFKSEDFNMLAQRMKEIIMNNYTHFKQNPQKSKEKPSAYDWNELFKILLTE